MRNRFHALCPYFAMFPESFAEKWIGNLTSPGDLVLDPFCGRGTTPFQALLMGRDSVANDVNPVAYCLTRAKTGAPALRSVMQRIRSLRRSFIPSEWKSAAEAAPPFFQVAFAPQTLAQLLYLRSTLRWSASRVDAMVAALTLGSLHGESQRSSLYLSNQMPRTISTKPDYSLRFWERHGFVAPERDSFALLEERAEFRYGSETPERRGIVFRGDMRELSRRRLSRRPSCVVTSPPYLNVTDFGEDQWLRLWFLGGPPEPARRSVSLDDRHRNGDAYWRLIADLWRVLTTVMAKDSAIVIRIGGKALGPEQLLSALQGTSAVSSRRVTLVEHSVSEIGKRQTDAFRPGSTGCRYELDAVFVMR